jgi:hypothetical protein
LLSADASRSASTTSVGNHIRIQTTSSRATASAAALQLQVLRCKHCGGFCPVRLRAQDMARLAQECPAFVGFVNDAMALAGPALGPDNLRGLLLGS